MWHHKPSMHDKLKIHTVTPSVSPLRCQTDCKISWSFSICRSVRWRHHLLLYWNVWRVLIKTEAVQEVVVQHPSSAGASWWKQRSDVILDGSHTALMEFLSVTGSIMENVGEGHQPWVSNISVSGLKVLWLSLVWCWQLKSEDKFSHCSPCKKTFMSRQDTKFWIRPTDEC